MKCALQSPEARTKELERSGNWSLAAIAHKLKQEREHVEEVEIEAERPHDGFATRGSAIVHRIVEFLNLLRIPCCQSGENRDPKDRDHPLQHRAPQETIDDHRNQEPDYAHHQKRTQGIETAAGPVSARPAAM